MNNLTMTRIKTTRKIKFEGEIMPKKTDPLIATIGKILKMTKTNGTTIQYIASLIIICDFRIFCNVKNAEIIEKMIKVIRKIIFIVISLANNFLSEPLKETN